MRPLRLLLGILLIVSAACAARAESFSLPGLQADSDAYANGLTARNPAGGTPQARMRAEQQAAEATRKRDWAAAAAAWESRIALGDASPAQWLALAEAQMRRTPPNAARALQAAWQMFSAVDTGPAQIPALALMADALGVLGRPGADDRRSRAALERAPDDPRLRQKLADARPRRGCSCAAYAPSPRPSRPAPASTSRSRPSAATTFTRRTGSGSIRLSPARRSRARAISSASPGFRPAHDPRLLCAPECRARTG